MTTKSTKQSSKTDDDQIMTLLKYCTILDKISRIYSLALRLSLIEHIKENDEFIISESNHSKFSSEITSKHHFEIASVIHKKDYHQFKVRFNTCGELKKILNSYKCKDYLEYKFDDSHDDSTFILPSEIDEDKIGLYDIAVIRGYMPYEVLEELHDNIFKLFEFTILKHSEIF